VLNAVPVNNDGTGTWTVTVGNGSFSNRNLHSSSVNSLAGGQNILVWTVRSRYGVCNTTTDTMEILRDRTPDPANAGPDRGVCDSTTINLSALPATRGGSGNWSVISGSGLFSDIHLATTEVTGLSFGNNRFRWTIVSQFGLCSGSSDDVIISRDQKPADAYAGDDQFLCNSNT
jgi:hypothetical protein